MDKELISKRHSSQMRSVLDQVRMDLSSYIDCYSNKTFAVRQLAKESGLSSKTIKRLLAGENKPTYQTLFRLYSVFLDEQDYSLVLKKCPSLIREEIKDYNPQDKEERKFSQPNFLDVIKKEPLLIELLIQAACKPLHKSRIAFRYGEYGLELLEKLTSFNYLKEIEENVFGITKDVPQFDGEMLKFIGPYFIHRFLKSENTQIKNQNVINFFAEGLNEAGKDEWIRIETESYYKKIEIANNSKYQGDIPMFSFGAIDNLATTEHP